jgi:hypothetical protein
MSRCAASEFITRTEKGNLTEYGPHHTCVWFCSASLDTLPPRDERREEDRRISLRTSSWCHRNASGCWRLAETIHRGAARRGDIVVVYGGGDGYIYKGSFPSAHAAAKAYDAYIWANNLQYYPGSKTLVRLTFPNDVHEVPGARTSVCIVSSVLQFHYDALEVFICRMFTEPVPLEMFTENV